VVPYVLISLAVLTVIFLFPPVATWLPSKIG
jgi:TRAP-type mannitol/chloroaromatic compound transport system permease large subunit